MKYLIIAIIIVVIIVIMIGVYSALVMASKADDEMCEKAIVDNENRCVCCGKIIPEGRQTCSDCENGVRNE